MHVHIIHFKEMLMKFIFSTIKSSRKTDPFTGPSKLSYIILLPKHFLT